MSKRNAPTIGLFSEIGWGRRDPDGSRLGLFWRLTATSLLLGSMFMAGCGRSDVVSPVSEQEMDELDLDFDDGLEAPEDVPSTPNEVPGDNP